MNQGPESLSLLRHAWDLLLTGDNSVPQIRTIMNDEWGYRSRSGTPIPLSSLYRAFTNPFYYGLLESSCHGRFPGTHDP